jgi:hypothetical protein
MHFCLYICVERFKTNNPVTIVNNTLLLLWNRMQVTRVRPRGAAAKPLHDMRNARIRRVNILTESILGFQGTNTSWFSY